MSLNNLVKPENYLVRSPLHRWHNSQCARFCGIKNSMFVAQYKSDQDESRQACSLGLVDISTLARTGFKGKGAPQWLASQGAELPLEPNQACLQKDGSLFLSLSWEELLIISDLGQQSDWVEQLESDYSIDKCPHTYVLPRRDSHCCFALTGEHAEQTLSKICAVDLRLGSFPNLSVVQTSLARNSAIIVRQNLGSLPCFYILSDATATEYLWEVILDAMQEFKGKAVGFGALLDN